jgi:hypothetical protein
MTKAEIRSLVRRTLPQQDKSGAYLDRYVDACIEKVIAQMLNDVWRVSPNNLQRYAKQYGYTTAITVELEASTGVYYSTLPESIIPFNDKSSGVRRISTPLQGAIAFFPMDFREMDLAANGCYFETVNSKIGYAVNQTRIEYYNMSATVYASGVRMDLVIPFSKYGETDEVKIPEVADNRTNETFMDRVLKILQVVRPIDQKDDNATPEVNNRDN